jgi:hypothetical protein
MVLGMCLACQHFYAVRDYVQVRIQVLPKPTACYLETEEKLEEA